MLELSNRFCNLVFFNINTDKSNISGIVNKVVNLGVLEEVTTLGPDTSETPIDDTIIVFNDISDTTKNEDLSLESIPILSKLEGLRNELSNIQTSTNIVKPKIVPAFENMQNIEIFDNSNQEEKIIIPARRPGRKRKFFDPLSERFQTKFSSSEEANEAERTNQLEEEEDSADIFVFKPLDQPDTSRLRKTADQKSRNPTSPTPRTVIINNVFSTPDSVFKQVIDPNKQSVFGSKVQQENAAFSESIQEEKGGKKTVGFNNNNSIRNKLRQLKSQVTDTKESLATNDFRAANFKRLRGRQPTEPADTTFTTTLPPFTNTPLSIQKIREESRNQNGRQENPPKDFQKINKSFDSVKNIKLLSHDSLLDSFNSLGDNGQILQSQLKTKQVTNELSKKRTDSIQPTVQPLVKDKSDGNFNGEFESIERPITQSTFDVQLNRVQDLANRFKALRNKQNIKVKF